MNKKIQLGIGALIIAAILGTLGYQASQTTVYFHTPGEIMADLKGFEGKTIRIGALVQPGSTEWDADQVRLRFKVTEDSKVFIPVEYEGIKPDLFREGQGVVVEGKMGEGNVFMASQLLVKHNEEYQVDQKARMDKEAAYRTLVNQ